MYTLHSDEFQIKTWYSTDKGTCLIIFTMKIIIQHSDITQLFKNRDFGITGINDQPKLTFHLYSEEYT